MYETQDRVVISRQILLLTICVCECFYHPLSYANHKHAIHPSEPTAPIFLIWLFISICTTSVLSKLQSSFIWMIRILSIQENYIRLYFKPLFYWTNPSVVLSMCQAQFQGFYKHLLNLPNDYKIFTNYYPYCLYRQGKWGTAGLSCQRPPS